MDLPAEGIIQFKETLVYIIQSNFEQHFSKSGNQFLIWKVFLGIQINIIIGMVAISFFQGQNAYTELITLLSNENWGRKFFDNNQQTFVVSSKGRI